MQLILYRESSKNWRFLFCEKLQEKRAKFPLDHIITIDNLLASFATFHSLLYDYAKSCHKTQHYARFYTNLLYYVPYQMFILIPTMQPLLREVKFCWTQAFSFLKPRGGGALLILLPQALLIEL